MTYLVYGDKKFKILEGYELNFSSREVTFSDVKIDFTNKTLDDLPIKYQEVIIYKNNKKEFTGYVNSFTLPEMKQSKGEFRELEINLLSPYQMATNKSITIIGTYKLKEIIIKTFSPMILDGYEIKELNVRDGIKTVNFMLETIEEVMNNLSNTEDLWWYIDENKGIHVNDIDYQFGLNAKLVLNHFDKVNDWISIQPSVEAINYANVINVKNVRVYFHSFLTPTANYKELCTATNIKNGDSIDFRYGVDISEDTIRRVYLESENKANIYCFKITINTSNEWINAFIGIDENGEYMISDNISFSDEDKKVITLKRDDFFQNLIIGFTYNGTDGIVSSIESYTALEYRSMKFINSKEIEINKNLITPSGVIEKNINMNERWFFPDDLITEIKSMMSSNSNQTNILKLKFDKDKNLKLGDIVEANLPNFLTIGKYIVTDINYYNNNVDLWTIKLKSADILENYIDLFRAEKKQENNSQIETVMIAEYIEEKINEKHEVIENG